MMRIKEQQHGQSAADSSDERPLVVIAGCGVSGAALALALQQRGMRVAIYEKDARFDSRSQGYGLTMQQVRVCGPCLAAGAHGLFRAWSR
jgi:glycine/D-amino acid oxidase-like deaminating enzyme